jgi:O-methyltransferase
MRLLRHLAGRVYRRRIQLVDRLSENVDFFAMIPPLFSSAELVADRISLHRYVNDIVLHKRAVDYLEFGVFQGDSLRLWLAMNADPSSTFLGFDTFTGLPEDWTSDKRAGTFDVQGKLPELDDPRVRLVPGLFQESLAQSLRSFRIEHQLVLHIDCDLYSAALFCLATLDPFMRPGTTVIFDEFYDVLHEFAAFRDYSAAFRRKWVGLAYTEGYTQVALQVIE